MSHQLHRLHPRHYRILDLVLAGMRCKDIAATVGVTPRTVSNVLGSAVFKAELARRRERIEREKDQATVDQIEQVARAMAIAAIDAAQTHIDVVRDDTENVRVRQTSATAILDRVGIGKGGLQGQGTEAVKVSDDHVELLIESIRQAGDLAR